LVEKSDPIGSNGGESPAPTHTRTSGFVAKTPCTRTRKTSENRSARGIVDSCGRVSCVSPRRKTTDRCGVVCFASFRFSRFRCAHAGSKAARCVCSCVCVCLCVRATAGIRGLWRHDNNNDTHAKNSRPSRVQRNKDPVRRIGFDRVCSQHECGVAPRSVSDVRTPVWFVLSHPTARRCCCCCPRNKTPKNTDPRHFFPSPVSAVLYRKPTAAPKPTDSTSRPITSLDVNIKVNVGDGEPIESALRRFKRAVSNSGHLMELRHKRYFENSQEKKKRKIKEGRLRKKFERMQRKRMAKRT